MFCPKCGSKLEEKEKFCKYCGTSLSRVESDTDSIDKKANIDEEDLVKSYVGNHYDKIANCGFSFPTFFFPIFYTLYRKMWLYSFLWVIFDFIVLMVFEFYTCVLVFLFVNALLAVHFSNLYLNLVRKRIQQIKQNNNSMSNEDMINLCKKKGNTSMVALMLAIFVIIIFVIFVISIYFMIELLSDIETPSNNITSNLLQYELPPKFSNTNEYSNQYQRFSYMSSTDYCAIHIKMKKNYQNKTLEDYFKSSIYSSLEDKVSDITTKNINGTKWNYVSISNHKSTRHYLATIKNRDIYEIEYSIYQDDTKYCTSNYEKFINSLDFTNTNKDFNSI